MDEDEARHDVVPFSTAAVAGVDHVNDTSGDNGSNNDLPASSNDGHEECLRSFFATPAGKKANWER